MLVKRTLLLIKPATFDLSKTSENALFLWIPHCSSEPCDGIEGSFERTSFILKSFQYCPLDSTFSPQKPN